MNIKGISKHAGEFPEFWRQEIRSKVPTEMKEWVIEQYFNHQTMSIYCDASIHRNQTMIGVGSSYIADGEVLVQKNMSILLPD